MSADIKWWAIGPLGAPCRLILTGTDDDARSCLLAGEKMALLHTYPTVPVMILADGSDVVEIPLTLAQQKARWGQALKVARDAILDSGCQTPVGKIDSDQTSRTNISGSVTMAMLAKSAGAPFSIVWRMRDNSMQTLGADAMIAAGVSVAEFVSAVYAKSFEVSEAITAASTIEEVLAIDLDAIRWPE